jgi:hypothetical protein
MNYLRPNGQPAVKLNSVNVIEYFSDTVQSLRAFVDNPKGNKEAEDLFSRLMVEYDPDTIRAEIEDAIEEGVYEDGRGYCLYLTHSV